MCVKIIIKKKSDKTCYVFMKKIFCKKYLYSSIKIHFGAKKIIYSKKKIFMMKWNILINVSVFKKWGQWDIHWSEKEKKYTTTVRASKNRFDLGDLERI